MFNFFLYKIYYRVRDNNVPLELARLTKLITNTQGFFKDKYNKYWLKEMLFTLPLFCEEYHTKPQTLQVTPT